MIPKKNIALLGVARSGTSWLGNIFDSSPKVTYRFQPLFSYEFRGRLSHESSREEYFEFLENLRDADTEFLTQMDKKQAGLYPVFEKSSEPDTLVFKENRFLYYFGKMARTLPDELKIVSIIRNPCAVINSWVQNPKEFPPGSIIDDEWRFGACKNEGKEENFFGFYKWREAANICLDMADQMPDIAKIIKYEDLVEDPLKFTSELFDFVGLQVTDQTRSFLSDSGEKHLESPYAVYKDRSVKDKWRDTLDKKIVREIYDELSGTRLQTFLA